MKIYGLHHVTAVTARVQQNLDFYTNILGLRLVKQTVNQDDVSAYHLFYADALGTPGTDMTFFDWPMAENKQKSSDTISSTYFRVGSSEALQYWVSRFKEFNLECRVTSYRGKDEVVVFYDPEGQELALINDGGAEAEGEPWSKTEIPQDYRIKGLYAVRLVVPSLQMIDPLLTRLLQWPKSEVLTDIVNPDLSAHIYAIDGGGPGKEVHVVEASGSSSWTMAGGVHHVAFRVKSRDELLWWKDRFDDVGLGNSGLVDRFYFKSLYFRISPGILFELATDGPGFAIDESQDSLGERLSLPPFLESERAQIESNLKPLEFNS